MKRLVRPFVSPEVFDFWAAKLNPLWSWERPLARVLSFEILTDGTAVIGVQPNRHFRAPTAGEWLPVALEKHGLRKTGLCQVTRTTPGDEALLLKGSDPALAGAAPGDILAFGKPETFPPQDEGGPAPFQVRLLQSGVTVEVPAHRSLLSSLEQQGLTPRHGCRQGLCNSCACVRVRGHTLDRRTGQASGTPHGMVRLCVSEPRSDLVIDL